MKYQPWSISRPARTIDTPAPLAIACWRFALLESECHVSTGSSENETVTVEEDLSGTRTRNSSGGPKRRPPANTHPSITTPSLPTKQVKAPRSAERSAWKPHALSAEPLPRVEGSGAAELQGDLHEPMMHAVAVVSDGDTPFIRTRFFEDAHVYDGR